GEHTEDSVPLVVLIHGGSWASQLVAESMDPYARDLVDRGMAVYNIEYRRVGSGGGWPTTFRDVASALDHVVELSGQHPRSEEHTSELQSRFDLVCRLLLEKKKTKINIKY